MDEREKYAKLYSRLISPQSDQSIVNYFSYKLEKLLEEEYVNNQSIDFWKAFKKFIQIREKRLNLKKDMNILYNTLEESLFDSQEPHKVLDILSWLDVKLTTITQPQPIPKQKPELKIDQIALKYAYEGLQITRENGNDIAKQYGHNSGEKLFQRFTYYSSTTNRKNPPTHCTPKKLDNKIKLIESVITLLPIKDQQRVKDEVSMLKKIYEADYQ